MKRTREIELAYAAGYIDGEGCITVSGKTCRVLISNTYPFTLHWMKALFGGKVAVKNDNSRATNHRPAFVWSIGGTAAEDLLSLCIPYLQEKRVQAEAALEYVGTVQLEDRKKLSRYISELKHRSHGGY